mgnify:FL=1|jgi:hypothetical protein
MNISKKNARQIANAFSSFGTWSDRAGLADEDHAYAIKRCAESVLDLVEAGIPHHLERWAIDSLANPFFSNAEYTG